MKENNGRIEYLNEKSKAPKKPRKSKIDPRIKEFIKNYRKEYPKTGKTKIKPELNDFCQKIGTKAISEPTIGRIIKDLKERGEIPKKFKVSLYGRTARLIIREIKPRKPKLRRKGYQPKNPGDLIQIDAMLSLSGALKDILSLLSVSNQNLPLPKPTAIYPLNQLLISMRS